MKWNVCILLLLGCLVSVVSADDLNWHRIGPVAPIIQTILPDRLHPGVFYLLVYEDREDSYFNRLYRSMDNGQSWQYIRIQDITDVMIHSGSSELFITRRGKNYYQHDVLSSNDFGTSFQLRSTRGPGHLFDHPSDPGILWGSGLSYDGDDLSVSDDRGAHWRAINSLPNLTYHDYGLTADGEYELSSVLVSPFNPKVIYVSADVYFDLGCSSESMDLELTSFNGGKTWSYVEVPTGNFFHDPAYPDRAFFSNSQGTQRLTPNGWMPLLPQKAEIVSVPGKPDELYAVGDDKQWVSKDGGSTWKRVSLGPGGMARVLVARSAPEGTFVAGTFGAGVYIIEADRNFKQITTGFTQASLADVATAPASRTVFAISRSFLYSSQTSGKSWLNITSNLPAAPDPRSSLHIVVDPQNGKHAFAEMNHEVAVTFDGGTTWEQVPEKPLARVFTGTHGAEVFFAKAAGNHLFKSTDGGRTLKQVSATYGELRNTIYDLAIDSFNGYFYVATRQGLFVSRDGGISAQQIATDLSPECLQCLAYHQIIPLTNRGTFLAVAGSGLYKTLNGGVTWQRIINVEGTIYVADDSGQHLFRIYGGLYETTDGGLNWNLISTTVDPYLGPNHYNQIYAMTDPRYRPLYLATSIGMYRTD